MDNADCDEPEKKRPHLSSVSSPVARNSTNPWTNNKCMAMQVAIVRVEVLVMRMHVMVTCSDDMVLRHFGSGTTTAVVVLDSGCHVLEGCGCGGKVVEIVILSL
ncbi:E3 ubiquitin-protein ligase BRE1-like 2 isoform X1 [Senna tora]|uniref:E3 ubiquitin-protein ligase BRE1-like 2 isoform X1 n=1 Tax=Senna tora TaxID=362788 RepID=A0A834WFC6_9FABA|nr:E3 ubiquitin-protein ligase BRE1-like 2 isoform X1 [Senna tora]